MSYGYDANVVNWTEFLGKVSKNGIKQHAQNLLETLASRRSDPKSHSVTTTIIVRRGTSQANFPAARHHLRLP